METELIRFIPGKGFTLKSGEENVSPSRIEGDPKVGKFVEVLPNGNYRVVIRKVIPKDACPV